MVKAGDTVSVLVKNKEYKGRFLPSEDEKLVVLKLESGYNIGFKKKDVSTMTVVEKYTPTKKKSNSAKQNKKLQKISILHTGGTIASKVDYATGGVSAQFEPEELLTMFPELAEIAQINSRLVRQMMSENMRFSHYNLLAKEIQKEVKAGVDGIIITHGTDTMHYTSAALAFACEGLPVPVILVGAQRSSDRGSSDASMNLLAAAQFIVATDFSEVAVCMHENLEDDTCLILPATKVRKMHSSRRDAFRPINASALARVNYRTKTIDCLGPCVSKGDQKLTLKLFDDKLKIGLLKSHTHMYEEEFSAYKKFDGLVVEGTALGQLPNSVVDKETEESGKIIETIRKLTKTMPVVMASQCLYGRIDMNVYAEGRINKDAGILGNYSDMTAETTFIKLAWLLSNYPKESIPELITTNFRGEISERLEDNTFLV